MTRVVLVVWGFETFGGMERHVCQLAIGLKRASVDVAVCSEMPVRASNAYAQELRAVGVPLLAAPRRTWFANALQIATRWPKSRVPALINGGGFLSRRLIRVLEGLTAGEDAVVVHVHGCRLGQIWLVGWARSRGVPLVYTEHVSIAEYGGPLTPDGPRLALSADVLACVSEHSRRSLASVLSEARDIAVTGHIVAISPEAPRGADQEAFEILCPARLEAHKGVDTLLRAFAILASRAAGVRLTIAGDGRLGPSLQRLAADLGVGGSTRFAGALAPSQMAQALTEADAVVLASRSEGLPLALLEAMARGKPVIAARTGGIPEIIRHGENGVLIDPDDPAALALALEQILHDRPLRARLGVAARQTFEESRHHERRVIPEMLDLYRQAQRAC